MESEPPPNAKAGELLVFFIRRDTVCGECGQELRHGSMITLAKEKGALCLECADLDHLDFLPGGNAALTRRASKHSGLRAIVLEWSRTRRRYERQGVLVEPEALERAERECLNDQEQRARQRERRRLRDDKLDQQYVAEFAARLRALYPGCPEAEAARVAAHACRKYSGRVGRSAAAKEFQPDALRLALSAAIRHRFTPYDKLLLRGHERHEARALVRAAVEARLRAWSA